MTTNPNNFVTAQKINTGTCVCTAAKTTYNDTTNAVLLLTAGADGSFVYDISAIARATYTDTQLQLYTSPDGGVTLYLLRTKKAAADTMAATAEQEEIVFDEWSEAAPLRLKGSERLYAAAGVALAGGWIFHARGDDL